MDNAASPDAPSVAIPVRVIAASALACAVLWALDLVLGRSVLTPFVGEGGSIPAAAPLYAFWKPVWRPHGFAFVLVAGAVVALVPRMCAEERTTRVRFLGFLLAAAIALPLSLFLVRQPLGELGSLLTLYEGEEVVFDAPRIHGYLAFLAQYVEAMPGLSLHGKHFPPGHVTWIHAVQQAFGPGVLPVALVVLGAFAAAIQCAYLALRELAGEGAARAGALLLLASPSLLDFACTSMDAVFLLWATGATVLAARLANALRRRASGAVVGLALATGVVLLAATFISFSALPVGLAIGLFLLFAGRRELARTALALVLVGAGYAATGVVLFLGTGFSIAAGMERAIELNKNFMAHVVGGDTRELHGYLTCGNATAFLVGSGVALVAASGFRLSQGRKGWTPWSSAALLTLAVMACGGIYFMETERIWIFAMPWLAAAAVATGPIEARSLRVLFAAGALQALAMESLLLTLWGAASHHDGDERRERCPGLEPPGRSGRGRPRGARRVPPPHAAVGDVGGHGPLERGGLGPRERRQPLQPDAAPQLAAALDAARLPAVEALELDRAAPPPVRAGLPDPRRLPGRRRRVPSVRAARQGAGRGPDRDRRPEPESDRRAPDLPARELRRAGRVAGAALQPGAARPRAERRGRRLALGLPVPRPRRAHQDLDPGAGAAPPDGCQAHAVASPLARVRPLHRARRAGDERPVRPRPARGHRARALVPVLRRMVRLHRAPRSGVTALRQALARPRPGRARAGRAVRVADASAGAAPAGAPVRPVPARPACARSGLRTAVHRLVPAAPRLLVRRRGRLELAAAAPRLLRRGGGDVPVRVRLLRIPRELPRAAPSHARAAGLQPALVGGVAPGAGAPPVVPLLPGLAGNRSAAGESGSLIARSLHLVEAVPDHPVALLPGPDRLEPAGVDQGDDRLLERLRLLQIAVHPVGVVDVVADEDVRDPLRGEHREESLGSPARTRWREVLPLEEGRADAVIARDVEAALLEEEHHAGVGRSLLLDRLAGVDVAIGSGEIEVLELPDGSRLEAEDSDREVVVGHGDAEQREDRQQHRQRGARERRDERPDERRGQREQEASRHQEASLLGGQETEGVQAERAAEQDPGPDVARATADPGQDEGSGEEEVDQELHPDQAVELVDVAERAEGELERSREEAPGRRGRELQRDAEALLPRVVVVCAARQRGLVVGEEPGEIGMQRVARQHGGPAVENGHHDDEREQEGAGARQERPGRAAPGKACGHRAREHGDDHSRQLYRGGHAGQESEHDLRAGLARRRERLAQPEASDGGDVQHEEELRIGGDGLDEGGPGEREGDGEDRALPLAHARSHERRQLQREDQPQRCVEDPRGEDPARIDQEQIEQRERSGKTRVGNVGQHRHSVRRVPAQGHRHLIDEVVPGKGIAEAGAEEGQAEHDEGEHVPR